MAARNSRDFAPWRLAVSRRIFRDYSPDVTPKSIDEAVIDLTDTLCLFKGSILDIGKQIKKRFREEIDEWMKCSIGVSTNRFLAKLAASLHKPDGLDIIDHANVLEVYKRVSLLDLNGINTRFQARLNAYDIFTPMEFYNAPLDLLKKQVFQSILGYYWYLRLRGHEIDAVDFKRKSFGNTYALQKQTNDSRELARLLMKLCEKTGRRLHRANYSAQGAHVACVYTDLSYWHTGRKFDVPIYTTRDIYIKALRLLNMSGYKKRVRNIAVSVYDLIPSTSEQLVSNNHGLLRYAFWVNSSTEASDEPYMEITTFVKRGTPHANKFSILTGSSRTRTPVA